MGTSIKTMLNTDRARNDGTYPLIVRIIHNRSKKMIYTPYHLFQSDFDSGTQKVVCGGESGLTKQKCNEINRYLKESREQLSRILIRLEREIPNGYSADHIIENLSTQQTTKYVLPYFEREIATMRSAGRFGSATLYNSTMNSLIRFVRNPKFTFKDIDFRFISDYVAHLQGENISRNSINMYLRNFRSVYNKAQKDGLIHLKKSPFADFSIGVTQTVKRSLSKDVIRRIAYCDLPFNSTLSLVRDIFMFSFYTRGMSLVDMVYLRHENIVGGVIYYKRNKTGQQLQIAISIPLRELIERYHSSSPFVFPILKEGSSESLYKQYRSALNQINNSLKRIGTILGLEDKLTTYVARHSWAMIAKTEGVSIATISEGLGHTTEKTTQIYLKAFDRKIIDEANAKITKL